MQEGEARMQIGEAGKCSERGEVRVGRKEGVGGSCLRYCEDNTAASGSCLLNARDLWVRRPRWNCLHTKLIFSEGIC